MSEFAAKERSSDRLGRYRLLAILGRGGMGDVYLAIAEGIEGFSKLLVVKELRRQEDDDELHLAMFMDEARLAARLNHPHIVQTLEVDSDGPRRFMVMEYLEGQPLQRVLRRLRKAQRPLPVDIYVGILINVLDALAYVHGLTGRDGQPLGIVHRDVSPQNIFVTYEGHVKLIDFGIAKTQVSSQQTSAGVVKGKLQYMAPEQATAGPVDLRTDVFSVGVMLWDALIGRGPWDGHSDLQILGRLMTNVVPRLRDQTQALPAELVAVVDRATSPVPDDRYASAAAMRDELLRHVGPSHYGDHTRALGEIVSRAFAQERLELRGLVDAQVCAAAVAESRAFTSLTRVRTRDGNTDSLPSVASTSFRSEVEDSSSIVHQTTQAPGITVGRRPRYRRALVVGALATAVAIVALTVVLLRGSRAPEGRPFVAPLTEVPTTGGTPERSPAPPATPAQTVHVIVRVLPAGAKLAVDGIVVSNPYVADLPRDDSTHTLTAEGPNLVARARSFKATSDIELELSLDRGSALRAPGKAVEGREHTRSVPPLGAVSTDMIPTPPPTPEAPSTSRPHRLREMDKENPYAP